jgi:sigma-B regulation protein RsbU (phosphoserine phosphatase)
MPQPEPAAPAVAADVWGELLALARDKAGERPLLRRALELWVQASGARAAALYLENGESLRREVAVGGDFPPGLDSTSSLPGSWGSVPLPGGVLAVLPPEAAAAAGGAAAHLTLLLWEAAANRRLQQQIKEERFQVNYRVVELEALYDVGLAVAGTLDRERLSEEILLRAISLLDARRGALYLIEGDAYRLDRAFGGEAAPEFPVADPRLAAFLAGQGPAPPELLPGARHFLGVPIQVEAGARGLLAAGDKESRRGIAPFPESDRRTLILFANQAALALENARLHRQALETERLEREMELAAEIQRLILPTGAPSVEGYSIIGWNRPARQVGGDYYDLLHLPEERIGLAIGDVSGKGVPAALMVSTLHSALRLLLDRFAPGPELLERLNDHVLASSAPNKFITLVLAELAPASGTLRYLNAGHNPGLLLRRDGTVEELPAGGLPIGLLPGSRYPMQTLELHPGDLLCLYSDGITECTAEDDEEFGVVRLADLLARHRDLDLPRLVDAIDEETCRFSAGTPQADDQTLVLLRRDG